MWFTVPLFFRISVWVTGLFHRPLPMCYFGNVDRQLNLLIGREEFKRQKCTWAHLYVTRERET